MKILPIIIVYTLILSVYDFRTKRIPNWATFPMIFAGLIAHFPGTTLLWSATIFVIALGFIEQKTVYSFLSPISTLLRMSNSPGYLMGMGDVKLWLACIWAVPKDLTMEALVAIALGWILMSIVNMTLRKLRQRPLFGKSSPVAWSSFLFSIFLFSFQYLNLHLPF